MAQRTLGALTTEALHDDFDASKYGTTAEQAIRDGIVEIARRARLPSVEATTTIAAVAGTRTYTLPADAVQVVALTGADRELDYLEGYHSALASTDASRATPTSYAFYGNTILLVPTPQRAETLTLAYLSEGTLPGGSADVVTAIEDADQWLLVAYARSRLFAKEDDPQMSDWWRQKFEEGLRLMRAAVQRRTNNRNRRIPGPYAGVSASPRFLRP